MSHESASKAGKLGYTNIKIFCDGYPAWVALVGEKKEIQISAGTTEGSIDLNTFRQILTERPDSVLLVDVRDPDEFAAGHFPTAVNIPTNALETKLPALTIDRPLIFVCATGARSGEAYYMVRDLRPDLKDVFYVEATITYRKDGSYDLKATP